MLNVQTFDNRAGGNVLYKALAHPLAAEAVAALYAQLVAPVVLYDPEGIADALLALYPDAPSFAGVYVHDVAAVGQERARHVAHALTDLPAGLLAWMWSRGRLHHRRARVLPQRRAITAPRSSGASGEHGGDEFASAAHAELVERRGQVLLDGVGRDV